MLSSPSSRLYIPCLRPSTYTYDNLIIDVPWKKARSNQISNDLLVSTTVKLSTLEDCGYGRFSNEEFIPRNTIFFKKQIIDIDDAAKYDNYVLFLNDKVIRASSIQQLTRLANIYEEATSCPRNDILDGFSNFIASHNGKVCHINTVSLCVNHANQEMANISTYYESVNTDAAYLVGITTKNIMQGEELFQNYEEFILPEFFVKWCEKLNLCNVQSFLRKE